MIHPDINIPPRAWRDKAANAVLWAMGVVVILTPGALVAVLVGWGSGVCR